MRQPLLCPLPQHTFGQCVRQGLALALHRLQHREPRPIAGGYQRGQESLQPPLQPVLRRGQQPLHGTRPLAAKQPVNVLPIGQRQHQRTEFAAHQLRLQLHQQPLRRHLPSAVAIQGEQQLLHAMALQELQLQRRDTRAKASHCMAIARLVELDHIQRSLHQQRSARLADRLGRLIQAEHQPIALEQQVRC